MRGPEVETPFMKPMALRIDDTKAGSSTGQSALGAAMTPSRIKSGPAPSRFAS